MSQMQSTRVGAAKEIDEYECSGNGPRPPVPGKESRTTKMTEMGCPNSSNAVGAATAIAATFVQTAFGVPNTDEILADYDRIKKWPEKVSNLFADEKGVELFKKFVEDEAGAHGIYTIQLEFYFACEGLKQQTNPKTVRQVIAAIYRNYLRRSGNDISVSTELRNTIKDIMKNEREPDVNIYHDVQKDVEEKIAKTTYPKFLQSKFYFEYADQVQKRYELLNNNYPIGIGYATSGSISKQYGGEMVSGCMSRSPCDSLDASCSNLQESLTMNTVLPTLHEDTELTIHNDVSTKSLAGRGNTKPKLTKESLFLSQSRRLVDVRPANAHGYNLTFNESFNPVSRQDSERQSCSSASQTDSETKSILSPKDGQPYMHRKASGSDNLKKCYINDPNLILAGPVSRERINASKERDPKAFFGELKAKLELVKEERDKKERLINVLNEAQKCDEKPTCSKSFACNAGLAGWHQAHPQEITNAILKKLSSIDADSDQAILDQHVSRVFSPHVQSPGTASPRQTAALSRPPPPLPHRTIDPITEHASQPIRSRSDQISYGGLTSRKSTLYSDSGISMSTSADYRIIDKKSTRDREEDVEKTRIMLEQYARPRHQALQSQTSPGCQLTNSLPRARDHEDDHTITLYQFCDEPFMYRNKLPSKEPTLKMFKDILHKKGNFRYFFKVRCDELQAVQEEFTSDADILPLFEGKVMGQVMPQ